MKRFLLSGLSITAVLMAAAQASAMPELAIGTLTVFTRGRWQGCCG